MMAALTPLLRSSRRQLGAQELVQACHSECYWNGEVRAVTQAGWTHGLISKSSSRDHRGPDYFQSWDSSARGSFLQEDGAQAVELIGIARHPEVRGLEQVSERRLEEPIQHRGVRTRIS